MSNYVTDYVDKLRTWGLVELGKDIIHPVLVLSGVAGTLRESRKSGTVITDLNETTTLSRLVGRVFPVTKRRDSPPGPIVVGRSADNDVSIADYSISNRHCYFIVGGRDLQIMDCGSTNGTFIDGRPLPAKQAATVVGGETVVLGRFAFLFMRPTGFLDYLAKQK